MNTYWKTYWDKHVDSVSSDDPLRQVLRVQDQQPVSAALFAKIAADVVAKLDLHPDHRVLDLCCGNGLLSAEVAKYCHSVVGVDFSETLVKDIGLRGRPNIIGIVSDVLAIKFQPETFDRILFAAALQHFDQAQVIRLFKDQARWLNPGGRLLITDILDSPRIWNFYNNPEREDAYFRNVMDGTPILGTWFDRVWLTKLARHAGFKQAEALDQPEEFLYSHYRFDLLCYK